MDTSSQDCVHAAGGKGSIQEKAGWYTWQTHPHSDALCADGKSSLVFEFDLLILGCLDGDESEVDKRFELYVWGWPEGV